MTARRGRAGEAGQVLVVFALLAMLLFSVAGLAVDTGHGYISQRASQSAGDAASLAGAGMLGSALRSQPPSTSGACDAAGVVQQALNAAALNGQATAAAGGSTVRMRARVIAGQPPPPSTTTRSTAVR